MPRSRFAPAAPSVVQGLFPLVFVILFLSTAFFPDNLLLEPAASIAEYNPLSFIVDGMRDPIISDALAATTFWKALGALALVGGIGSAQRDGAPLPLRTGG